MTPEAEAKMLANEILDRFVAIEGADPRAENMRTVLDRRRLVSTQADSAVDLARLVLQCQRRLTKYEEHNRKRIEDLEQQLTEAKKPPSEADGT